MLIFFLVVRPSCFSYGFFFGLAAYPRVLALQRKIHQEQLHGRDDECVEEEEDMGNKDDEELDEEEDCENGIEEE